MLEIVTTLSVTNAAKLSVTAITGTNQAVL